MSDFLGSIITIIIFSLIIFFSFVIPLLTMIIKIINQYERGIRLRLGKYTGRIEGPGLILLIPFVDKMIIVDIREIPM
ncbi:MAG: SPFH domain-containing protein, partial [bacterium]